MTSKFAAVCVVFLLLCCFSHDQNVWSQDPSTSASFAVYAKVILPLKPPSGESHRVVESWISKKLRKQGKSDHRAVTDWVRLADKGEDSSKIWSAMVDGKLWGCPVDGRIGDRTKNDKIKLELVGWSPGGAEIKGNVIPTDLGSRRIARVDTGADEDSSVAYVAIIVVPASTSEKVMNQENAADSSK